MKLTFLLVWVRLQTWRQKEIHSILQMPCECVCLCLCLRACVKETKTKNTNEADCTCDGLQLSNWSPPLKKKSPFLSFTSYILLFHSNSGIIVALTSTSWQDIYLCVFWFHQRASFTSGLDNNESALSKSQTPVDLWCLWLAGVKAAAAWPAYVNGYDKTQKWRRWGNTDPHCSDSFKPKHSHAYTNTCGCAEMTNARLFLLRGESVTHRHQPTPPPSPFRFFHITWQQLFFLKKKKKTAKQQPKHHGNPLTRVTRLSGVVLAC